MKSFLRMQRIWSTALMKSPANKSEKKKKKEKKGKRGRKGRGTHKTKTL